MGFEYLLIRRPELVILCTERFMLAPAYFHPFCLSFSYRFSFQFIWIQSLKRIPVQLFQFMIDTLMFGYQSWNETCNFGFNFEIESAKRKTEAKNKETVSASNFHAVVNVTDKHACEVHYICPLTLHFSTFWHSTTAVWILALLVLLLMLSHCSLICFDENLFAKVLRMCIKNVSYIVVWVSQL